MARPDYIGYAKRGGQAAASVLRVREKARDKRSEERGPAPRGKLKCSESAALALAAVFVGVVK